MRGTNAFSRTTLSLLESKQMYLPPAPLRVHPASATFLPPGCHSPVGMLFHFLMPILLLAPPIPAQKKPRSCHETSCCWKGPREPKAIAAQRQEPLYQRMFANCTGINKGASGLEPRRFGLIPTSGGVSDEQFRQLHVYICITAV